MPKQTTRIFSAISDAAATEAGQTMHDLLEDDLADFTGFDSEIDPDYVLAFQAAITAAATQPTDETVLDGIEDLTQTVEEQMELCRTNFQDSKYFIERAFPNRQSIRNKFGFDDYDKASKSQKLMIGFMDNFSSVANEYSVELGAVGYGAAAIAEIAARRDALIGANRNQEQAIKNRPVQTQERIQKLNAMWVIMQRISKISKRIYKDNWAKFHQYLLPGTANEPDVEFNALGTITTSEDGSPIEGATIAANALGISVSTDANGLGGLVLPEGDHELTISAPGHDPTTHNLTIPPGETVEFAVALTAI